MEGYQKERKQPYNPYPLAGGNAAKAMPDKKAADVFQRLCVHTDFLGTTTVSILTLMDETRLSHGSVVSAIKALKEVGRIARVQRGRLGAEGGRKTALTRVFCTKEELLKAGVTDENFYSRGGKDGVIDLTLKPSQTPKSSESKAKSKRAKSQTGLSQKPESFESKATQVGLEPLESEPSFLPLETEPLESRTLQSNPTSKPTDFSCQGKKENQSQSRERQGNTIPADKKEATKGSAARPPRVAAFKPEVESQFRAAGAPDLWFEAMAPFTDTIDMLNGETPHGCPFPVESWLTVSRNHPNWKASQLWVPKITESGDIAYSEANSLADQILFRRMNEKITDAEREVNRARFWWGSLTLEQMYDTVPRDTWTTHKDGIVTASEAAILEAYRQAKGVKGTKVEAAVVEEREYAPVDDI
jgi:hypothetical protein